MYEPSLFLLGKCVIQNSFNPTKASPIGERVFVFSGFQTLFPLRESICCPAHVKRRALEGFPDFPHTRSGSPCYTQFTFLFCEIDFGLLFFYFILNKKSEESFCAGKRNKRFEGIRCGWSLVYLFFPFKQQGDLLFSVVPSRGQPGPAVRIDRKSVV